MEIGIDDKYKDENEPHPFKDCAKCGYSRIVKDLDQHGNCIDCAQIVFRETARECAISEVCEDCNGHYTMHNSGCEETCEPFKDKVEEIIREWENRP